MSRIVERNETVMEKIVRKIVPKVDVPEPPGKMLSWNSTRYSRQYHTCQIPHSYSHCLPSIHTSTGTCTQDRGQIAGTSSTVLQNQVQYTVETISASYSEYNVLRTSEYELIDSRFPQPRYSLRPIKKAPR